MPTDKQQIQKKEHVLSNVINFSNVLMKSPLRYTLMERRFLYKLASLIRERFNLLGLDVRKNWDNLFFEVSNKDLAEISGENSGKNNVIHTYDIICKLADRTIVQYCLNKKGELEIGRFHWINSFVWNADTNCYTVEVSSQLYDYVCCMTSRFTHFNLRTGIILSSKYSQKFFEICSMYTSDKLHQFRFMDKSNTEKVLKSNVLKISVASFRFLFGLTEIKDARTGKIIEKAKLVRFRKMEEKVILPAREELFNLYMKGISDVWFDYSVERNGKGRNGSPKNLFIFFYTKRFPKSSDALKDCPRGESEVLEPYEDKPKADIRMLEQKGTEKSSKIKQNTFNTSCIKTSLFDFDIDNQRLFLEQYLKRYLSNEEVNYYMAKADEEQKKNVDSYSQILQELLSKYKQESFLQGTDSYKKKCIIDYVFNKNLMKYGWNIPPMHD